MALIRCIKISTNGRSLYDTNVYIYIYIKGGKKHARVCVCEYVRSYRQQAGISS